MRRDAMVAVLLTVAVELEVLLGTGTGGSRAVTAVAAALVCLPLAFRRAVPLLPLAALAVVLLAQTAVDGFLVEHPVTLLAVLLLALYSAGRHVTGVWESAGAVLAMAVLAATRITFDPAVDSAAEAILTIAVLPLPFLVGAAVQGQDLLRRDLLQRTRRAERERAREAEIAVEEERARIAAELHAVIADEVRGIVAQADGLADRLRAGDPDARGALAAIARTARTTLADVRRVLGILRRDEQAPLAPTVRERAPAAVGAPADTPGAVPRDRRGADRALAGATAVGRGPDRALAGATAVGRDADRALAGATAVRRDPRRADRALAAALLLGAGIELALVGAPPGAALTALLIVVPLLWRRRRPVAVALAVLAAMALQSAVLGLDSFPVSSIVAVIAASYAVGAHADRRRAIAGLGLLALGAAGHALAFYPEGVVPALVGGVALPWTVGRVVRNQRLLTAGARERAERAERERAQEARAAVVAERSRVARELHDVVAHGISVVAIQAAGAHDLADRDPARAARTAALIETVGRDALAELERLFGPAGTDEPQPSLARVDGLARRARDGGLPVELHVEGTPAALPAGVDLAAYRIVQEALANASKHAGDARTQVVVRYRPREVEVEVCDDGRGRRRASPAGGGHGLIGMRERVTLYGGSLDAGRRPAGGFRVRASLPIGGA